MMPILSNPIPTAIPGVVDNWSRGHWSLVISHWLLVIGHWSLVIGHWSLVIWGLGFVIGHWSLVIGH
jgi:hypothetical protein